MTLLIEALPLTLSVDGSCAEGGVVAGKIHSVSAACMVVGACLALLLL